MHARMHTYIHIHTHIHTQDELLDLKNLISETNRSDFCLHFTHSESLKLF
jgi:hypothetical protein